MPMGRNEHFQPLKTSYFFSLVLLLAQSSLRPGERAREGGEWNWVPLVVRGSEEQSTLKVESMGACQGKEPSPTPHPPPRQRQWEPVPSLPDAGGRARHHLAPLQLCQPPPPSRDQACQATQPSQNSLCPHSILPKGTSTSPGQDQSPPQSRGGGRGLSPQCSSDGSGQ